MSDTRHHVTFDKYLIVLPTCRMPARESSSPSLQPSGAVCVDLLAASGSPGVEVATRLTQSRCLSLFPRHFLGRVTAPIHWKRQRCQHRAVHAPHRAISPPICEVIITLASG